LTFIAQAEALRLSTQSEAVARWGDAEHVGKKIKQGAFEYIADDG